METLTFLFVFFRENS